ncbi:MAG: non-canonical purine NTP diphosphatase [Bacteroidaceae bacterium]|nr:non-canonical purine NTP diphosphatase [Bacteroidaceae bacterium]
MTRKLLIMATNNEHKLKEVRQILDYKDILIKGLEEVGCYDDIPETADTLEGNALLKARYMYSHYGVDCFADDTGLEVEALVGQPGVFTERFGQMNGYGNSHDADANMQCLLDKLQGKENRKARFRTVIALVCEGKEYIFEGIVEGEILTEKSGQEGFGYDPIFSPEGKGISFAEMSAEEKNQISHRGRAVEKLIAWLKKEYIYK